MGTVFLRFLVGGLMGLLAWMVWEPSYPKNLGVANTVEINMIMTAGVLIGAGIAGLSGFAQGGIRHTSRGVLLGALFGLIGIRFGYTIGNGIVVSMYPAGVFVNPTTPAAMRMTARFLAILPAGAFLGLAVGAATLNVKRAIQGLIGGLLAGAAAGLLFDPLAAILEGPILAMQGQRIGETGGVSRAVTFCLLGASIGLFIGLVERIARSAWLRLHLGRNEGKEWSIDSAQTFIGRSESATVPLFGDPNVAPIHASIQRQGPGYVLIDGGSPMGTYLNGHRIQSALLVHGSEIQIGGFVLQFMMKNQPAPMRGPEMYGAQAVPFGGQAPQQVPVGAMPFNGAPMNPQPPMGQPPMTQPPMGQAPMGQPGMPMPGAPTQAFMPPAGQPTMAYGAGGMMQTMSLVAIDGPLLGQRFPVGGPLEIGREGTGIRLAFDANASRRHASVAPAMTGVAVTDLGSTNGTFVNGQRVSQAAAALGDLIKIGSTTFRLEPA